jgi:DNA processing protein
MTTMTEAEPSRVSGVQTRTADSGAGDELLPLSHEELLWRIAACLDQRLTAPEQNALITRFGGLSDAAGYTEAELAGLGRNLPSKLSSARARLARGDAERELDAAERIGARALTPADALFPPLLRQLSDAPVFLWMRGKLSELDHLALAIVGSRNSDIYGVKQSERFASLMAARRITVVSGLARGIDTAAHRGALSSGGRTIAVVGSGLANLYPPENVTLASEIAECGAVLSEFPLTMPGLPKNFPQRNRIISGLCLGVLVTQAGMKSGSLITARLALEQGRDVFAVPGKVDTEEHRGCHMLIKEGAKLVEDLADILQELPAIGMLPEMEPVGAARTLPFAGSIGGGGAGSGSATRANSGAEAAILRNLKSSEPVNIEQLVAQLGIPAGELTAALLTLELRGAARQLPGRNYVLG